MNTSAKPKFELLNFVSKQRALALLLLIVVFCIIFSIVLPATFGTLDNFAMILLNMSSEAMILVAITLVLILAEIDLSLGSIMVFGGILCGRLIIQSDWPATWAILVPLVISLFLGFINGTIVSRLGVPSFIATLATGMIYLGIAVILSGTGWTDFRDPIFKAMGQEHFLGLQLPVYYMFIIIAIFAYLVGRTRYFRQLYYIGDNQKAAELSGINIARVKITSFVLSAFLACLSGIVVAMRFNSAMPNVGTGVELRAVTAAVIGGVSFTGGSGTVIGAAMGALFIAVLNNALTAAQVSPDLQYVVTGIVLILAIVLDIAIAKKEK